MGSTFTSMYKQSILNKIWKKKPNNKLLYNTIKTFVIVLDINFKISTADVDAILWLMPYEISFKIIFTACMKIIFKNY